jgi:hypothetical protein
MVWKRDNDKKYFCPLFFIILKKPFEIVVSQEYRSLLVHYFLFLTIAKSLFNIMYVSQYFSLSDSKQKESVSFLLFGVQKLGPSNELQKMRSWRSERTPQNNELRKILRRRTIVL